MPLCTSTLDTKYFPIELDDFFHIQATPSPFGFLYTIAESPPSNFERVVTFSSCTPFRRTIPSASGTTVFPYFFPPPFPSLLLPSFRFSDRQYPTLLSETVLNHFNFPSPTSTRSLTSPPPPRPRDMTPRSSNNTPSHHVYLYLDLSAPAVYIPCSTPPECHPCHHSRLPHQLDLPYTLCILPSCTLSTTISPVFPRLTKCCKPPLTPHVQPF